MPPRFRFGEAILMEINQVKDLYDQLYPLALECTVANVAYSLFKPEMRFLPAALIGGAFALSSSVGCLFATKSTLWVVPPAFKSNERTYFKDHPFLSGFYFVTAFAVSLLGTVLFTQACIPFFNQSISNEVILKAVCLDMTVFLGHFLYQLPFTKERIEELRDVL